MNKAILIKIFGRTVASIYHVNMDPKQVEPKQAKRKKRQPVTMSTIEEYIGHRRSGLNKTGASVAAGRNANFAYNMLSKARNLNALHRPLPDHLVRLMEYEGAW